jgi:hypothetical protein
MQMRRNLLQRGLLTGIGINKFYSLSNTLIV